MDLKGKAIVVAVIGSAFAVGNAFAAEPGFYIGVGGGESTAKASTEPVLISTPPPVFNTFHFDKSENSFKGFVGYNFLPWLGVEAGYVSLGHATQQWTRGTTQVEAKVDAYGPEAFLVGLLPLGPVDLFVKVGAINSSISLKLKDSVVGQPTQHVSADESNGMMAYGGGAAYNFGRWALRAEYEAYDVSKLDSLYVISGSVTYRFGGG